MEQQQHPHDNKRVCRRLDLVAGDNHVVGGENEASASLPLKGVNDTNPHQSTIQASSDHTQLLGKRQRSVAASSHVMTTIASFARQVSEEDRRSQALLSMITNAITSVTSTIEVTKDVSDEQQK